MTDAEWNEWLADVLSRYSIKNLPKDPYAAAKEGVRLGVAIAREKLSQHYPTPWAYEQACAALEKWKQKAEALAVALEKVCERNDIEELVLSGLYGECAMALAEFQGGGGGG